MFRDPSKTEKATPKRKRDARKKGQVAKSPEVASVVVLVAALLYFYFGGRTMIQQIMELMRSTLRAAGHTAISADSVQALLGGMIFKVFGFILPFLLTLAIAGFLANMLQIGFRFSPEALKPQLSKLNPIKGFKGLFSLQGFAQLFKSILKMAIVGGVVYVVIRNQIEHIFPLVDQSLWGMITYIGQIFFKIVLNTCWVLIVLAIADYAFQRWQYEQSLKMTKQEVQDEHKQSDGDPQVKSRVRGLQMQAARRRMMAAVPKADVVITNPTHIAVAIRYDPDKTYAPVVVAKGTGFLAERIREIAAASDVPIVENKPVAQLLYKIVEIDEVIPENLYKAVAEILAYVYGLRQRVAFA